MGERTFTRSLYTKCLASEKIGEKGVTARAEQKAKSTGELDPLVDPSKYGVIRQSLPRVGEKGGYHKLLVGTPMPIETRLDTTGSMGDNVDIAMKVLPDAFELWSKVLEGYDLQVATGIFGDVSDDFPLCRPQFEMHAEKIVKQLTLMVPEKDGGDTPEDPDLGIFGGAYLVRSYLNRIGLKRYDFTVTDAPGRGRVDVDQLIRIYGAEVFNKVEENGYHIDKRGGLINLDEIWNVLLDSAHAFILQVGKSKDTKRFWEQYAGKNRVVSLPETKYLPHVQAVIIGLTEGSLLMNDIPEFLKEGNMDNRSIDSVVESVINIPICAQAQLPNFSRRPEAGDLFAGKPNVWDDTNLWPDKDAVLVGVETEESETEEHDDWL